MEKLLSRFLFVKGSSQHFTAKNNENNHLLKIQQQQKQQKRMYKKLVIHFQKKFLNKPFCGF